MTEDRLIHPAIGHHGLRSPAGADVVRRHPIVEESGRPALTRKGNQTIDQLGNVLWTALPDDRANSQTGWEIVNGHMREFLSVPWCAIVDPSINLVYLPPQLARYHP